MKYKSIIIIVLLILVACKNKKEPHVYNSQDGLWKVSHVEFLELIKSPVPYSKKQEKQDQNYYLKDLCYYFNFKDSYLFTLNYDSYVSGNKCDTINKGRFRISNDTLYWKNNSLDESRYNVIFLSNDKIVINEFHGPIKILQILDRTE